MISLKKSTKFILKNFVCILYFFYKYFFPKKLKYDYYLFNKCQALLLN